MGQLAKKHTIFGNIILKILDKRVTIRVDDMPPIFGIGVIKMNRERKDELNTIIESCKHPDIICSYLLMKARELLYGQSPKKTPVVSQSLN